MISFRPVDLATDLPALARLVGYKLGPITTEQIQEWWRPREDRLSFTTVALHEDGQVVGMVDVDHEAWKAPEFRLSVAVEPEWRCQGIGAQLFEVGLEFAQSYGAERLVSSVGDNAPEALRFAEKRGYHLERHTFESALDLTTFDEQPFVAVLERARDDGIRFFSLADLGEVTEEVQRKLYELNRVTGLDNPGNRGVFPPFEAFRLNVFEASWFRPDGQILAADGERWVGLAAIAFYPIANYSYNAFTGVLREYRGRGLACALKLMAIRRARQYGATRIRTDNDSQNAPMLAVNRKLGYQPEPGLYYLIRKLT
jgi:GNAT superfamily N-acetyltransferase